MGKFRISGAPDIHALLSTGTGRGALDVVLLLLGQPNGSAVGAVVDGVELPQATVTRRLQELEAVGLVDHARRGQPYRLREREGVAALLQDASKLSEALLALDESAEQAFRERLDAAAAVETG